MSQGCLSDLALEALILKSGQDSSSAHLTTCLDCQGRLTRMEADGVTFRREVYPRTLDAILAGPTPFWRRWLVPLVFVVPATAAVLLMTRPPVSDAPPQDGLQSKGAPHAVKAAPARLDFQIFAGGAEGVHPLVNGSQIAGEARLRFSVSAPEHCWFSVVSVDGSGGVSQLYPAASEGIEVPRASLPGGTVLEGGTGPERIFALCSPRPTPVASLTEGARNSLPKNAESIRGLQRLPGLPGDVLQETVLVERSP